MAHEVTAVGLAAFFGPRVTSANGHLGDDDEASKRGWYLNVFTRDATKAAGGGVGVDEGGWGWTRGPLSSSPFVSDE